MGLVRAALRNPYLVVVLALLVVVLGAFSATRIPTDLLPVFRTPAVQILTLYPGMPAEVMERDIMSRLERWTGQSNGIEHQEGRAMQGVCIVKDFFHEEVDPNSAMSQVSSLAMSDLYYLPPGTVPPMVMPFDPTASIPLVLVSVSSETMTEKQLYDIAYFEMRNQLQAIPGVIAPAVYGGVLRRIHILVDPSRLEARGLSPMDVVRATNKANLLLPAGSARVGDSEYLIVTNAMVPRVADLDDVPVAIRDGRPVFVRDIGRAVDSQEIQTNIVRVNGCRQVYLPLYRQPGANTLEIVDTVRERVTTILARIRAFYPEAQDLRLDTVMDQSVGVRQSIDELRTSALLGALFVAVVVLAFLASVRSTVIALVAVPLSILAALFGLFLTRHSINAMTLGGLSLAVGIMTEYSIVVLENVSRHLGLGKTRIRAALDGAGEVALPVLVAAITTVVVFFPVIFLRGIAGFLFTPLALAVTFALGGAYLVSLTVVPAACARFLSPAAEVGGRPGPFDRMAGAYGRLVASTLRARGAVLAVGALLVAGTGLLAGGLGTELFPPVDAGQFTILVRAPAGTRLEETEALVKEVEAEVVAALGRPDPAGSDPSSEVQVVISNIGVLLDWPAAYTPNTGSMDAFVLVQLKDGRRRSAPEQVAGLRPRLRARFPGADLAFDTGGMLTAALNGGLPSPIDIRVQGSSLEVLDEMARAIAQEAAAVPGAVDVRVAQRLASPAIRVDVDRTRAALLGLTEQDVVENLVTATSSSISFAKSFWIDPKNGNHYFIGTQYSEESIESLQTLEDIPVTGAGTSVPVPLRNVATLVRTTLPAVVDHRDITRTFDVYAGAEGRDVGGVAADIEALLETSPALKALLGKYEPQGYRISMRGEVRSLRESFGQLGTGFAIAAVLIYLVLVWQFRSFRDPLVILLAVPLGLAGAVGALSATGTALNIPAFMGAIMTIGLVVSFSVIFVDFANNLRREGLPLEEAVVKAAGLRLRPILMVSLSASAAMLPLALGETANAPLAITILGGILAASLGTLLLVPAAYAWISARRTFPPIPEELA